MEKHTFSVGHMNFSFPKKALLYYPWLNKMFGYGECGESKQVLETNLIEFMSDIEHHIIRKVLICLKALETTYQNMSFTNMKPIELELEETMSHIESFLSNGPGATKGFDIPYQCIHCNITSMVPKPPRPFISHNIKEYKSNNGPPHMICIQCGINWYIGVQQQGLTCLINDVECIHQWK